MKKNSPDAGKLDKHFPVNEVIPEIPIAKSSDTTLALSNYTISADETV